MASTLPDGIKSWIEYEKIIVIVIPKQTQGHKTSSIPDDIESWIEYEKILNIVLPSKEKMKEHWNIQKH